MRREFAFDTLPDLIRSRVSESPDETVYTFLNDGENDADTSTFAELNSAARRIAAAIQEKAPPGDRALLLYAPGLDYVRALFACLYAGVVAVPVYPPDAAGIDRHLARLERIITDAHAGLILTTEGIAGIARAMGYAAKWPAAAWLTTDTVAADGGAGWNPPALSGADLAILQYTSGSTGAPKGVMLSHHNLLCNLELIRRSFQHDADSQGVIWLPPYHDMGLIGGILEPAYAGFPVALMSPLHFIKRPMRWLRAITRFGGTVSGGPSFAYGLCVRKCAEEDLDGLDLSTWTVAFNGAEPVSADVIDRFCALFAPVGFRRSAFFPCYGLAECTLIVSGGDVREEPRLREVAGTDSARGAVVGCGRALDGCEVVIAEPATGAPLATGEVGEIWVSGASVAGGYWKQEEASRDTFSAFLSDGRGPFCRTGDLGFLDDDGELFVSGRCKDVIVVNGRNLYPHDIEETIAGCHAAIRRGGCAVFESSRRAARLGVAVELSRGWKATGAWTADEDAYTEILTAVNGAVWREFGLPVAVVALVAAGQLPKTSSGKIQRFACRQLVEGDAPQTLAISRPQERK